MELVYLWVEDYKNIKKQGFNFSSKFDCSYDEENNELTVNEKKDYVNIFPDNINITAIIGENGSGKSSVIYQESNNINDLKIIFDKDKIHIYEALLLDWKNTNPKINIININNNTKYALEFYSDEVSESDLEKYKSLKKNVIIDYTSRDMDKKNKCFHLLKNTIYFNWDFLKYDDYEEFINTPMYNGFRSDSNILLPLIKNKDNLIDYKIFYKKFTEKLFFNFDNIIFDNFSFQPFYIKIIFNQKNQKLKELNILLKKFKVKSKNANFYILAINIFQKNIYKIIKDKFDSFIEEGLVDIEYIDKDDRILFDFSYGERAFFIVFILLLIEVQCRTDNLIIYVDEIDLGIHPNWQKSYITKLLKNFEKLDKNIHIIITSHSPFILSDLPKENIIFLENGKQKYPFKDKQTFGANIHTLLSNGFFMKDGLMGEFAKSKITEIKRFYELIKKLEVRIINDKHTKELAKNSFGRREKRFKDIQSIIGEPFLQTVIGNYLDELHLLFSDDDTLIDKELLELEERKKYLERIKNA